MSYPMNSGLLARRRYRSPRHGSPAYGLLDAMGRADPAISDTSEPGTPLQGANSTTISPFRWLTGQVGLLDVLGRSEVGAKDRTPAPMLHVEFERTMPGGGITGAVGHHGRLVPQRIFARGDESAGWYTRSSVDSGRDAREAQPRPLQLAAGTGRPKPETVDDIYRRYEGYADDLRELGADVAADAMRRYLDKTGGIMQIGPEKLRRAPVVQQAQQGIYQHFKDWMTHATQEPATLGGKSPGYRGWAWQGIAPILRNLKDGETIHRSSHWDRNFDYGEVAGILES